MRHHDATPPRACEAAPDLVFQQRIARLHRLGARCVYEFLRELIDQHGPSFAADFEIRLAAYLRLTPEMLAATGGDTFAPLPLHAVEPVPVDGRPVFEITVRPEPDVVDVYIALRAALKRLLRSHGLKCLAVTERGRP